MFEITAVESAIVMATPKATPYRDIKGSRPPPCCITKLDRNTDSAQSCEPTRHDLRGLNYVVDGKERAEEAGVREVKGGK